MIIHYLYCISTNQRTIFHRHRSLMSTFYQNYFFARCWTKQPPMKKVRVRRSYTTHIRRVHIRKRVHETYINHIRSPYTNASYMEKIFSSSIYPIRTVTSYQRGSDDTIHIDVTSSIESMVTHFWPAFQGGWCGCDVEKVTRSIDVISTWKSKIITYAKLYNCYLAYEVCELGDGNCKYPAPTLHLSYT